MATLAKDMILCRSTNLKNSKKTKNKKREKERLRSMMNPVLLSANLVKPMTSTIVPANIAAIIENPGTMNPPISVHGFDLLVPQMKW